MKIFLLISQFLFFTISGFGQVVDPALSTKLQGSLDSLRNAYQIKGVSACIYLANQGYWKGVSGISHLNVPINPDMEFGIGSNTKLFTAVSMLKLMETNSGISLDDSISDWLPAMNNVNPNITIRQLLNHTSGLADYTNFPGYADSIMSNPNRVFQPTEFLSYIGNPIFQPGNGSFYSNTNYLLAGLIFQSASNQSLPSYLRTNILNLLQFDSTFFDVFETVNSSIAHPWQNGVNIQSTSRISLNSAAWCSGAMYSTAGEMAQWYKALLIDKTVLNQNSFSDLTNFEPIGNYGLGIGKQIINGRVVWGHGGDIRGYRSRMMLDTATHAIIIVLTNSNPLDVNAVAAVLLNVVTSHINITAVEEENINYINLHIYPNPTQNQLTLSNLPTDFSGMVSVYNTRGQLIYSERKSGSQFSIETGNLNSGIYFIHIRYKNREMVTRKLLISR